MYKLLFCLLTFVVLHSQELSINDSSSLNNDTILLAPITIESIQYKKVIKPKFKKQKLISVKMNSASAYITNIKIPKKMKEKIVGIQFGINSLDTIGCKDGFKAELLIYRGKDFKPNKNLIEGSHLVQNIFAHKSSIVFDLREINMPVLKTNDFIGVKLTSLSKKDKNCNFNLKLVNSKRKMDIVYFKYKSSFKPINNNKTPLTIDYKIFLN